MGVCRGVGRHHVIAQRRSGDVLHDDDGDTVDRQHVVDRDDVRMSQTQLDAPFVDEAPGGVPGVDEPGVQHLDRHRQALPQVGPGVDGAGSTDVDQVSDLVMIGEDGPGWELTAAEPRSALGGG